MSTPTVDAATPVSEQPTPPQKTPAVEQPAVLSETVRSATFEALLAKPRRRDEVLLPSVAGDGQPIKLRLKLEAISAVEYDQLVDAHPAKAKDRERGSVFDINTFGPALLERVVVDPKLTYEQWRELWNSPDWAGGEIGALYGRATRLCQGGLDVPFTESG